MKPAPRPQLQELQQDGAQRQIQLMRRTVEDAAYDLWEGNLSDEEAETLAREIRIIKEQIASLEVRRSGTSPRPRL